MKKIVFSCVLVEYILRCHATNEHYSRKASESSSSCTLFDGHFPLKMLSNAVAGPAPSLSDDSIARAAAVFAATTSSDMILSLELNNLLLDRRCEMMLVAGKKAEVCPRSLDVVASNRGTSLTLSKRGDGKI
jgi:hypothetical protein